MNEYYIIIISTLNIFFIFFIYFKFYYKT